MTETTTSQTETSGTSTDDAADPSLMSAAGGDKKDDEGGDKADGGDKKEGEDKAADADKAPEPPEKYELTAPEGLELTPEIEAEVTPVLREAGVMSDEAANKVLSLAPKFLERITKAQTDAHEEQGAEWAKEAQADPRLGGKEWANTERFVAKAFDTAAAGLGKDGAEQVAAFKKLLDDTRLGNHPVLMRMFRFYGERISEDSDFTRGGDAPVKKTAEAALYDEAFQPKT